jgi:glycine/D-amino acid oxidase-like deaminating enzyme/nitrite reductase/ring-hydroxylating ferredoxin subunit
MTAPHLTGNSRSLSYWIDTTPSTSYPPLASDGRVDVCVVGGGIAGITAAYLLAKAGKSVVVLDRERVAMAETGHTTAHLQIVMDTRLGDLVPRFGFDSVKLAWDSQLEAARLIESIAQEHRIPCELTHLDAYLYSDRDKDKKVLRDERRLARKMGYGCDWADAGEIPFPAKHALLYEDQRKFHARKYLLGVVREAEKLGVRFHEGTEVTEVERGTPAKVKTAAGPVITAEWVLSCTNTPFYGAESIHTKIMPYRTYAIGARVPRGLFEEKLYWDTLDPYHYTRVERQGEQDLVILGGEDHFVGAVEDTEKAWGLLWQYLGEATDQATLVYRWSGEVIETADDFPYIGRIPGRGENELMITGDSGTGMTNGTLGALMLAERVLGRGTPWDELFDAQRIDAGAHAALEWTKHNLHAGGVLAKRALQRSDLKDIAELRPGDGAIMKQGVLKPVAVARLADGQLCGVSGVCTHMGCTVKWNSGETSWDCPCHGSRFAPTGEILHGPATKPLAPVDLEPLLEDRQARVEKAASARRVDDQ